MRRSSWGKKRWILFFARHRMTVIVEKTFEKSVIFIFLFDQAIEKTACVEKESRRRADVESWTWMPPNWKCWFCSGTPNKQITAARPIRVTADPKKRKGKKKTFLLSFPSLHLGSGLLLILVPCALLFVPPHISQLHKNVFTPPLGNDCKATSRGRRAEWRAHYFVFPSLWSCSFFLPLLFDKSPSCFISALQLAHSFLLERFLLQKEEAETEGEEEQFSPLPVSFIVASLLETAVV